MNNIQLEHNCINRMTNAFGLDRQIVFITMTNAVREGMMTFDSLESALTKVLTIIKTEEQFKTVCEILTSSTRMGININKAVESFIEIVTKTINKDNIKTTMKDLDKIIEVFGGENVTS